VAFNGTPVRARTDRDVRRFTRIVRESAAGEPAPIVFLRDGERETTSVTLGERPTPARQAGTFEDEVFGLTVRNITTEDRIRLNLGQDVQGVLVTRVEPGSWANLAGMVPGAIVLNFGGAPVTNVEDFERAVTALAETKPGNIAVFSQIGPRTGFFRLNPRWDADDGE
jgi:serine protease Do